MNPITLADVNFKVQDEFLEEPEMRELEKIAEEVMTPRSTSATAHSAQNWVMLISEQHRYICLISHTYCSFLNIVQRGGEFF